MVRLNITLPLAITRELNKFSGPRKRSQFIAEAIKLRIRQLKEKKVSYSNFMVSGQIDRIKAKES